IAFDRNDRRVVAMLARAIARDLAMTVPAGIVGQVWRDGAKQARLARLLGADRVDVEPLDDARARAAGQLCGVTRTRDVIGAAVVLGAKERGDVVLTSDVEDLRRLDPNAALIRV